MDAVEQAVDLLHKRRSEALHQVAELNREVERIDDALAALGYPRRSAAEVRADPEAALRSERSLFVTTSAPTITGAVRELMERQYGPWSPAEARVALQNAPARGDRNDVAFNAVIRTAFHSLRAQKVAVQVAPGKTVAKKWLTDAEAPVAAGASDGEESSYGSSGKEGGTADGAAPPVGRDRDSSNAEFDHGHGYGAPLVGVS